MSSSSVSRCGSSSTAVRPQRSRNTPPRRSTSAAASLPWLLYDGDTELEDHPLLDLLARPNPQEEGQSLFERWHGFLQSAGNAYLEAVTLDGVPRELHVLRPDRMAVVPGARGWPMAYDHTVEGRTRRIGREANGFLPVLHPTLETGVETLMVTSLAWLRAS